VGWEQEADMLVGGKRKRAQGKGVGEGEGFQINLYQNWDWTSGELLQLEHATFFGGSLSGLPLTKRSRERGNRDEGVGILIGYQEDGTSAQRKSIK